MHVIKAIFKVVGNVFINNHIIFFSLNLLILVIGLGVSFIVKKPIIIFAIPICIQIIVYACVGMSLVIESVKDLIEDIKYESIIIKDKDLKEKKEAGQLSVSERSNGKLSLTKHS